MNYERETIKERLPIRAVFDRFIGAELDRSGKCRCPFHSERTASFRLYESNNSFYCYGCGKGGDAVKLFQLLRGIDTYYHAMQEADKEFGLGVFQTKSPIQQTKEATQRAVQRREHEARVERKRQNYFLLTDYAKSLAGMPKNAAVLHDIAHIDRLLDQFGKWSSEPFEAMPNDFDAAALVAALKSKHGEVKTFE